MRFIDFLIAQSSIVRTVFETQSYRTFVVRNSLTIVSADKLCIDEVLRALVAGEVQQLCDRYRAVH